MGLSQQPSHAGLINDVSQTAVRPGRAGRLDAIVVPAARRAHHLVTAAALAAETGSRLVVIASHDCTLDEASEIAARTVNCRALLVRLPHDYEHEYLRFETSDPDWRALSAGRRSDLSAKRNLGLLLARLNGWEKILFLDDDITRVTARQLVRVAAQLDQHQVVGMKVPSFADNSVVCHANRLSGGQQDVFVTGAVLGVNCQDHPLSFFPDVYNEDWFFFAHCVQAGGIRSVGEARQAWFDPFADPTRAAREEFGDLLAEGLYALFGAGWGVEQADAAHWRDFSHARAALIQGASDALERRGDREAYKAIESLRFAAKQLASIRPEDCVDFVAGWRNDRSRFARLTLDLSPVQNTAAAMDQLELAEWREVSFGDVTSLSRSSRLLSSPGIG